MLDNVFYRFTEFLDDIPYAYLDLIRENNPEAFTRHRKIDMNQLLLQMFSRKGKTQLMELRDFYSEAVIDFKQTASVVAFYNARMKFNPEALRIMSNDFISDIYDKENASMVKLNGYIVTGIDGSDFILPSTIDHIERYGRAKGTAQNIEDAPVMGKLSVIYDCINKCVLDQLVGEYKHSENDFASKHLNLIKENLRTPTITTFDRGYYSIKLVDQMVDNHQKFLFRLKTNDLKRYVELIDVNEDKTFDVTFNRQNTNSYRNDNKFRMKLMSTTYKLRIVKIPIVDNNDNEAIEILLTNLAEEEFDMEALKELYHLRWEVETAYNVLKNKMKIEEFSGYRERLILQDIYSCIWLYNLIMLRIIEVNEKEEIPEKRYQYKMKTNVNVAIGLIKSCFIKSVMIADRRKANNYFEECTKMINKYLVPIRKKRNYKRGNVKNKSRMSYRYSY